MTRPELFIMAYACEPGKGSEPGVGWNWAFVLSKYSNVTVMTRANNRANIEAAIGELRGHLPKFEYYDLPRWIMGLKRGSRGLYWYYVLWQIGAYFSAKRLFRSRDFSHVLQLTFGSIWLPQFAHRLGGKFIWGPLGGGERVPNGFARTLSKRAQFSHVLRFILIKSLRFNPFIIAPLAGAEKVLLRTHDSLSIIPHKYRAKCSVELETGVNQRLLDKFKPCRNSRKNTRPVVLYVGRLVGFKNVDTLLNAAKMAQDQGSSFDLRLVGDGPEREGLEKSAKDLDLQNVTFVGNVTQSQVIQELKSADIFAFPSLREAGTWSLIEAMASGCPAICIDTSGMSDIADKESAIMIRPTTPAQVTKDFASALVTLCADPKLRAALGENARTRIRSKFLWENKGRDIARQIFAERA